MYNRTPTREYILRNTLTSWQHDIAGAGMLELTIPNNRQWSWRFRRYDGSVTIPRGGPYSMPAIALANAALELNLDHRLVVKSFVDWAKNER